MSRAAERINTTRWLPSERFHLLFLSEGFTTKERFDQQVGDIAKSFLELDPWSRAKIGIWSRYDPSARRFDSKVGAAEAAAADAQTSTALRFYKTTGSHAWSARPELVVDALRDTHVTLKIDRRAKVRVPAELIWLRKPVPDFSAVCVLIDADDEIGVAYDRDAGVLAGLSPPALREAFQGLAPLVVMSAGWPEAPNLTNKWEATGARLAHELGHVFELADEYEWDFTVDPHPGNEDEYRDYGLDHPGGATEPNAPNLTADATLRTNGSLDPQKLKWRGLVPAGRRDAITSATHPDPEVPSQVAEVVTRTKDSLLHLQHPSRAPWGVDLRNRFRYLGGALLPLEAISKPNLIEGGGYYRRGVLRPALECMMRYSTFDAAGDNRYRAVVGYCPVCLRHIAERLADTVDFDPTAIRVFQGDPQSRGALQPSRLAAAFTDFVKKNPKLALSDPDDPNSWCTCVETTVRRYETFLGTIVGWRRVQRVPMTGWYSDNIEFPFRRSTPLWGVEQGGWHTWYIWMSRQSRLRERGLAAFAGLGAAGALVYSGFGSLVNEPVVDPAVGPMVESLSPDALERVAPGSLLQLWKGRAEYLAVLRYAAGLDPVVEEPPPRDGHSVVYMGRDGQKDHVVADQFGTATKLSHWREQNGYDFMIAAQWFDGWWPGAPERP